MDDQDTEKASAPMSNSTRNEQSRNPGVGLKAEGNSMGPRLDFEEPGSWLIWHHKNNLMLEIKMPKEGRAKHLYVGI